MPVEAKLAVANADIHTADTNLIGADALGNRLCEGEKMPVGLLSVRYVMDGRAGVSIALRRGLHELWDDRTVVDAAGELPIPPYLNRETETSDLKTYQTVYSRIKGSVAAPTAGLHFTESVLADLHRRGIETDELTLHVGAGTFLPVKTADANEHTMHTEIIAVPRETIAHILAKLGSIVAVGTTSMRTLESLYFIGCKKSGEVSQFEPYEKEYKLSTGEALQSLLEWMDATGQDVLHAETQIMIKPGYTFHVVDQLITNFHQPQSTLLLLVSAFVGGDWHTIYDYALSHDFRFLSYGDSSILTRSNK